MPGGSWSPVASRYRETVERLPSFRRKPESTVAFRGPKDQNQGRERAKPKTPDNSRGMRVGTRGWMDSANHQGFAMVSLGGTFAKVFMGAMRIGFPRDVPVCTAPLDSGFRRNDVVLMVCLG